MRVCIFVYVVYIRPKCAIRHPAARGGTPPQAMCSTFVMIQTSLDFFFLQFIVEGKPHIAASTSFRKRGKRRIFVLNQFERRHIIT